MSDDLPSSPDKKTQQTEQEEAYSPLIVRTGQKLLAQTKRTLPLTERTKAGSSTRKSEERPEPAHLNTREFSLTDAEKTELVEVTDARDRPLLCMRPATALRQGLRFRLVLTALRTHEDILYLQKRPVSYLGHQGKWDVYTGTVRVNESREDAAFRLLNDMAKLPALPCVFAADRPGTDKHPVHATLFVVELPTGLAPEAAQSDILAIDADELNGLMLQAPELLTPELLWAASTKTLFRGPKKKRTSQTGPVPYQAR